MTFICYHSIFYIYLSLAGITSTIRLQREMSLSGCDNFGIGYHHSTSLGDLSVRQSLVFTTVKGRISLDARITPHSPKEAQARFSFDCLSSSTTHFTIMDFIFGKNDRKRKADDVDEEEEVNEQQDTKKQLLDNNMGSVTEQPSELQSSDNAQQQEQQPSTENDASNGSAEQQQQDITQEENEQQESVEKENQGTESNDNVQDAQGVEQPSSQGNEQQTEEATTATTQTPASSKVQTVVPFDRLIVLTVSATCDENSTSIPGSIQVTKENSEVIGK